MTEEYPVVTGEIAGVFHKFESPTKSADKVSNLKAVNVEAFTRSSSVAKTPALDMDLSRLDDALQMLEDTPDGPSDPEIQKIPVDVDFAKLADSLVEDPDLVDSQTMKMEVPVPEEPEMPTLPESIPGAKSSLKERIQKDLETSKPGSGRKILAWAAALIIVVGVSFYVSSTHFKSTEVPQPQDILSKVKPDPKPKIAPPEPKPEDTIEAVVTEILTPAKKIVKKEPPKKIEDKKVSTKPPKKKKAPVAKKSPPQPEKNLQEEKYKKDNLLAQKKMDDSYEQLMKDVDQTLSILSEIEVKVAP